MRKVTIIAQCLINSGYRSELLAAENTVRRTFEDEFPERDFQQWNDDINENIAQNIINGVGKASSINVIKLINDLMD